MPKYPSGRARRKNRKTLNYLRRQGLDPMNTNSDEELNFGHSLLHNWAQNGPEQTDWGREAIRREHARLVRVMEARDINHDSPLKFDKRRWG